MARITFDPNLVECPDFTLAIYALSQAPIVNLNNTEEQAVQILKDVWKAGNDDEQLRWQQQNDEDAAAAADKLREEAAEDVQRVKDLEKEQEDSRKDEIKKNKSKYTLIPDREALKRQ